MDLRDRPEQAEDPWKHNRLAEKALAQGTRDVYERTVARFNEWRDGSPVTDALVADYLGVLFDRGLAPGTASVVVAAIAASARRKDASPLRGELTDRALAGFRRHGAGRGPGQVDGLSWEQADHMADLAEGSPNRVAGLRDALFLRIASDCLLRVAEVSALDVADISLEVDWLRVVVRRSKTDQEGKGAVLYAGPPALRLARLWLAMARIDDGPLFRPVNKAERVATTRLSARSIREIIKRRAVEAGFAGRVSGHSLRVGAAQSLRDAGATTPELLAAGRWKRVETMAHYTSAQEAKSGPVACLRYGVQPPNERAPNAILRSASSVRSWMRPSDAGARQANGLEMAAKRLKKAAKRVEKRLAHIDQAVVGSGKADFWNQTQFFDSTEFSWRTAKCGSSVYDRMRSQRNASLATVFLWLRARAARLQEGAYAPGVGLGAIELPRRVRSLAEVVRDLFAIRLRRTRDVGTATGGAVRRPFVPRPGGRGSPS